MQAIWQRCRPAMPLNCSPRNSQFFLPAVIRTVSSGSRWKQRQGKDAYAREAKVQGLKSRAAFKLLEIDSKYRIFRSGMTVVDLGYAPGSWSQVALERTKPRGSVVGIDLIPAQPPRGVATFQGDFLSPVVQELVKDFISQNAKKSNEDITSSIRYNNSPTSEETETNQPSDSRLVDVVLSDMSAPWEQVSSFNSNTLSNPYYRLMNTSGVSFRDHAGSMDLCDAALRFASETLKPGGHFVCKFYQGAEDKVIEERLKKLFRKVHREKPESSRSESKEAYFIGLQRK